MAKVKLLEQKKYPVFQPTDYEDDVITLITQDWVRMRNVLEFPYNQFNGRQLGVAIDDWQKRWNGWIPPANPLLDSDQSRMFLNITRKIIIEYLSNVAMQTPKVNAKAINKKLPVESKQVSMIAQDMLDYAHTVSEDAEKKYFDTSLSTAIKGSSITYEGMCVETQDLSTTEYFDPETGKVISEKIERTIFNDCYQEEVMIEDFGILNPFQPDVQKQPAVAWRKMTDYSEVEREFGHYKNWKYVQPGTYSVAPISDGQTFYRQGMVVELQADQCEVIRYFRKDKNFMGILVNGIPLYYGSNPFKHGKYPFTKVIHEPADTLFFWGLGFPNKIMGEQDLANTFWNMMADKTFASLLPYGLSSDLDELIEDDILMPNKVRKVSDINKWKFDTLPGVSGGETAMLQQTMNFIKENAGTAGGANAFTPRGGKLQTRQVLLQQQQAMKTLGFSSGFMETYWKERSEQRLLNMIQFYSIPRVEMITGKNGKEIEDLVYRTIMLPTADLSEEYSKNGNKQKGARMIKLVGGPTEKETDELSDEMTNIELIAESMGVSVQALAFDVEMFDQFKYVVSVQKNSAYERNQVIDQAKRQDYAAWRFGLGQVLPVDATALVGYVNEAYDLLPDQFNAKMQQGPAGPVAPTGPGEAPAQESIFGPAIKNVAQEQAAAEVA